MVEIPITLGAMASISAWPYISIGCVVAFFVLGIGILFYPPSSVAEIALSFLGAVIVVLVWPLVIAILILISLAYVLANVLECIFK